MGPRASSVARPAITNTPHRQHTHTCPHRTGTARRAPGVTPTQRHRTPRRHHADAAQQGQGEDHRDHQAPDGAVGILVRLSGRQTRPHARRRQIQTKPWAPAAQLTEPTSSWAMPNNNRRTPTARTRRTRRPRRAERPREPASPL